MDPDRIKRRQSLKVIFSEAIMVIAVIFMVIILAFLVSGYWINSDFKVERQGLLQISSMPTGANVEIDGDSSWLQRTNTSKVLPSGEHTIVLTKDGYDSWSKTITIPEGLLYRLHYPRLFLQNASTEEVFAVYDGTPGYFSPDGSKLLLIDDNSKWRLVDLGDNKSSLLDVSGLLNATGASTATLSYADISSLQWSQDGSAVLLSISTSNGLEWIFLDTHDEKKSVNLTKTFAKDFRQLQFFDHSSDSLLGTMDGDLYKITLSGQSLSSPLARNVSSYSQYDAGEVVFSAIDSSSPDESRYYIGLLKINDGKTTKVLESNVPMQAVVSKFYDDKYITVLKGNTINVYTHDHRDEKLSYELDFVPENIKAGHNGEFVIAYSGNRIATLDMESESVAEWNTDSIDFGWLDDDMIYNIDDAGNIVVYDYDGLNRRIVVTQGAVTHSKVSIYADKWLYFFNNNYLVRKMITD